MKYVFMTFMFFLLSPNTIAKNSDFDSYVEGALSVYSQFKRPSKDESERFYAFIQQQWVRESCTTDCDKSGKDAANRYVKDKNIEIKEAKIEH